MAQARDIVVMAASVGALEALRKNPVVAGPRVPGKRFHWLHIGAWPSVLLEVFQSDCPLPVMHAEDGRRIARATVYVAPPDRHMLIRDGVVVLSSGPKENFCASSR
ncbi:chemotaxis protein CheB [Paraburkholderia caledonica]